MMIFSYAELEKYTVESLKLLCGYYEITVPKRSKKHELIAMILENFTLELEENENSGIQMSARVRRLKELNK